MAQVPFWKHILGGGPLRPGVIQRWASEYLASLDEWGAQNGINKDHLYVQEYVESPEMPIYLLSRVHYRPALPPSDLAAVAFMAGLVAGVRRARRGVSAVAHDIADKYIESSKWVTAELEAQRGEQHAQRYLDRMIAEERLVGMSGGLLAEAESKRDTRLAAFFEYVAGSVESIYRPRYPGLDRENFSVTLAIDTFKVGLAAGARAYMQGYVKAAKK